MRNGTLKDHVEARRLKSDVERLMMVSGVTLRPFKLLMHEVAVWYCQRDALPALRWSHSWRYQQRAHLLLIPAHRRLIPSHR
jgi:hypothetical protein